MSKHRWKEYFAFSKRERAGIVILVIIIALLNFTPYLIPTLKDDSHAIAQFKREIELWKHQDSIQHTAASERKPVQPVLKPFDPNKITREQWISLGVSGKTATTISKYVAKGGRFESPEHLKKIYGFRLEDYHRLRPYISIPTADSGRRVHKKYGAEKFSVEINSADSAEWVKLPGIGARLSQRIINFRNKLGGFYNINQIAETYGLADSVFQRIKPRLTCDPTKCVKISLNTVTRDQLLRHPYGREIASVLIAYREQHGPFESVEQIQAIHGVSPAALQKIIPYLTL